MNNKKKKSVKHDSNVEIMTQLVITGRSSFILYFSSYGFKSIDFEGEKKSQVILLREPSLTHCACLYLMTAPLCSKPQIISACCYLVSYLLKKDGGLSSKTTTYAVSKKMALFLPGYCTARALCSVVVLCQNTIIFHWDILWISINICRLFTFSAMFVVFCFISGALWPDCWRFLVIKAGNQIPFFFFYWSENSCWMQLFSYSGCNDVVKRHAFFMRPFNIH